MCRSSVSRSALAVAHPVDTAATAVHRHHIHDHNPAELRRRAATAAPKMLGGGAAGPTGGGGCARAPLPASGGWSGWLSAWMSVVLLASVALAWVALGSVARSTACTVSIAVGVDVTSA